VSPDGSARLAYDPPLDEWPIECTTCATIPGIFLAAIRMHAWTKVSLEQNCGLTSIVPLVSNATEKGNFSSARKSSARLNFYSHSGRRKPETISWRSCTPQSIAYIWFDNDPEIKLLDPIHSDTKSVEHIAHVYGIEKNRSSLCSEPASECQ
jgi:hypothetical protein